MENGSTKLSTQKASKYLGSQLIGEEIVDKITKEEFAAIAFFLAQRLGGQSEKQIIIDEYNSLCDNGLIFKKPI